MKEMRIGFCVSQNSLRYSVTMGQSDVVAAKAQKRLCQVENEIENVHSTMRQSGFGMLVGVGVWRPEAVRNCIAIDLTVSNLMLPSRI